MSNVDRITSKIKLSMSISPEPSEERLLFARQLGIDCVYTWVSGQQREHDFLLNLRQKVENAGLNLYNVGNLEVGKSDKIHLALPGRDKKIEEFQAFIRNLGRAGIHTTTFTWEPSEVWSSGRGETRGAATRSVDLDEMQRRPLTHDREYAEEELWENFEYFIRRIIPVAEESGVRLALHPNDPPAPSLGGIPCLIRSFENYKRAFDIAGSPYLRNGILHGLLAGRRGSFWRHAGSHSLFPRTGQDLHRSLSQRQLYASIFCGNLPGQRVYGYVRGNENLLRGWL